MASSLAPLLLITAGHLVLVGEADVNFLLGAGRVASLRRRRNMADTSILVFLC